MSDSAKRHAGLAAAALVRDGMRLGLGTGSTAAHAIRRIGERIQSERLQVAGVPTSQATARLAAECGVPLIGFDDVLELDLTIDGADEIDGSFQLIKGGGGALLREKIVASRSAEVVIIADQAKLVARLGTSFALPVEVVPFAWRPVQDSLARLGAGATLRRSASQEPVVTDNGNWILDARFPDGIEAAAALETAIDAIPGVVESGLFVGLATRVIVGRDAGAVEIGRAATDPSAWAAARGVEAQSAPRT